MFERVTLSVSDRAASERFYDLVLGAIGREDWADVVLVDDGPATSGLHIGFAAPSRADVDAFWQAGVDAGHPDDGAPGPRPVYGPDYYGGFLLDPDGNSAEAVHGDHLRSDGAVDHLWIGVSDLAAATKVYRTVGDAAGFGVADEDLAARVHFRRGPGAGGGSFSLVADGRPPTRNLRLAFIGDPPLWTTDPDGNVVEVITR
jgi:catechol 2,3-dioxygenase-like lactoylglutathione lyase family enzyme